MNTITVGMAEDHNLLRHNIVHLLARQRNIKVIIAASNGAELIHGMERELPQIVLLDLRMPVMDGFEAARRIKQKWPTVKIICLTDFSQEENIIKMNQLGVKSFLSKQFCERLPKVLEIVSEHGTYFPDEVMDIMQRHMGDAVLVAACPYKLNQTEMYLIQAICEGKSSAQIRDILCRSPRTVEKYREDLYEKFGVNSKEQLIILAIKWSLYKS